jgi:hypothetical protein
MIRYKIVNLNRSSLFNTLGKYVKYYYKGEHVKSIPNTLGLFVFDTYQNAKLFINSLYIKEILLLEVDSIGEEKVRPDIPSILIEESLDCFYSPPPLSKKEICKIFYFAGKKYPLTLSTTPIGTICCQELLVLD